MTPAQFAYKIRFSTGTNSTTFTNADIIALANIHIDTLAGMVLQLDEGYFGSPQTQDLAATADDFSNREYPLPTDMLNKLLRVEAKLDGTSFVKLVPFDLSYYGKPTTDAEVLKYFANTESDAYYDVFRNSLWIYSGAISAVVTDGLKLWTYTWPAHLTDLALTTDMSIDPSSTTHGFPRILHPILADLVSIDYKSSREKPIPLTEAERNIEHRTIQALSTLDHVNKEEETIGYIPDGSTRGYNGAEY